MTANAHEHIGHFRWDGNVEQYDTVQLTDTSWPTILGFKYPD